MSIGIYKIENLSNHKIYIGQSIHIEKRWLEHCQPNNKNSLIKKAILEEGKTNFSFTILEECSIELLDEREQFYIKKFNSLVPNGYNVTSGGTGHNENFIKYSPETIQQIITDIKSSNLSFLEIADKYNMDISMVYYLNRGDYHTQENETYPLREVKDFSKKYHYCIDCGVEISKGAIRCSRCSHKLQRVCDRPSREVLKDMIRTLPFTKIAEKYNVTDKAVSKWCKNMNLPYRKKDIKAYSDESWSKI